MSNPVRIAASGDLSFNGPYEELAKEGRARVIFAEVSRWLKADITIGNLESPLTNAPSIAPPWRFCLRGNPEYAAVMRDAGFTVLTLANNHIMDYGVQGLKDTLYALQAAGIAVTGAGLNSAEARKPAVVVIGEEEIAVLAYCSVPVGIDLYATAERPGVALATPELIAEDIGKARASGYRVIVAMHWGQELVDRPTPAQRRLARVIAESGAELLIGHHPHVGHGVERIGKTAVAYSLGNFVFASELWEGKTREGRAFTMDYLLSDAARRSCVLTCQLGEELEFHPVRLGEDLQVVPQESDERQREWARLNRILKSRPYTWWWGWSMLGTRVRVNLRGTPGAVPWYRRLTRIRPRHLVELGRTVAREWQQFRGSE